MNTLTSEQLDELLARSADSTLPLLTIIRGASGSGKSTKARAIQPDASKVCTTDDALPGLYGEDGSFNGMEMVDGLPMIVRAHIQNAANVEALMKNGADHIVVPNTNTRRWEFEGYLVMAYSYGYRVNVDDSLIDCGLTAEQLHARGLHGVPLAGIQAQMSNLTTYRDWKADSPTQPPRN